MKEVVAGTGDWVEDMGEGEGIDCWRWLLMKVNDEEYIFNLNSLLMQVCVILTFILDKQC